MMATGYPHHPAGLQHGIPHGQSMGPGPGPNPGQPLSQAMQMHPGVSGPNGPHVSQAGPMMAGMQPGVGPSAHAMSHLAPQAHMFQQQQQQHNMQQALANNPTLLQQQRNAQHQAYLRQQQQQIMQQQQQQNGMAMGFPNGINPQQMAAIAANSQGHSQGQFPILPPHIQQQLATQRQQMQQHQHQAAQAQAQQHAAQQQQQQQHIQHMAMQHAASQSSNPGQPGPQGAQTQQPQQGPLRPPSRIGGAHEGQASPAQQPNPQQAQQPQQQQQQQPQQQQPQAQSQPQNLQQQSSQQQHPQNSQQAQQRQQQQQQVLAQQTAPQRMVMRQPQAAQSRPGGGSILKLLNFANHLSEFSTQRTTNSLKHWQDFVAKFFSEEGAFKHLVWDKFDKHSKQFEICYAALPRYFMTQFDSGVESVQITIDGAMESFGNNCHYVESPKSKFIYWFKNGTQLICTGKLSAIYGQSEKMDLFTFEMQDHQQYLPRTMLERLFAQASPSQMNQNQSPRISKTHPRSRSQRMKPEIPAEPSIILSDLPEAPISSFGVTSKLLAYLEVGETIGNMQELMAYSQQNPHLYPSQAISNLVSQLSVQPQPGFPQQQLPPNQQQRQQQGNLPPNAAQLIQQQALQQHQQQQQQQNLPPGARTPSGLGQPGVPPNHQFMSPAIANLSLPSAINGSPHLMQNTHTPSPAQTHNLIAQHSQQGPSSSAGASANTSPNVNKRRRSTVKVEGDDGGGEVNGTGGGGGPKVKQSPRVGGNKRVKASG